jgi:hypothetical protein
MKTPLTKIVLLVSSLFMLAACGKSSSGGGGEAPKDTKIALKSQGVKKVLVDSVVGLDKYIVNPEKVSLYKITEGENVTAEWTDEVPKIHFLQAGTVKVIAADAEAKTFVEIVFDVTLDTTGIVDVESGGDEVEVPDNPVLHL